VLSLAQSEIIPTDKFIVSGKLKNEMSFNISELKRIESTSIGDIIITNHLGIAKDTLKNANGVLL